MWGESTFIAFFAAITALATLLAVLLKSRHNKKAVEELKVEKASTDYVALLEGQIKLQGSKIGILEHHVNECEEDRKVQTRAVNILRDENWALTKRMVENLMENSKTQKPV
jgi:hypothetical protein